MSEMQRQIKIEGQVGACKCGRQPKHYEEKRRHFCECSPCGTRTPKCETFNEALSFWEAQDVGAIAKAAA